jgi:hypothetical protein
VKADAPIAFRISAFRSLQYVTAVPNGGLNTKDVEITGRSTFIIADLNGGDLVDGDTIQIKWAPTGAKPTYWAEGDGTLGRTGGKPKENNKFKIVLKRNSEKGASGDVAPFTILLKTASGKFVSAPNKAGPLATADAEDKAVTLEIVEAPAPATPEAK